MFFYCYNNFYLSKLIKNNNFLNFIFNLGNNLINGNLYVVFVYMLGQCMYEMILKVSLMVLLWFLVIGYLQNYWVGEREMRLFIFWYIFEIYSFCFFFGCVSLLFMQIISLCEIDDKVFLVIVDLNFLYKYKWQYL